MASSKQHASRGAALLIAAALLAAAVPQASARSLLQTSNAVCTIDSSTQLDFKEISTACVAPSAPTPPRDFCDACTCALFSAFTPALKAAGVTNASDPTAASKGVAVVAACVNSFLAQFVAAKVDIQALVSLSSCEYKAGEVPACLASRVAALTGGTTPAASPVIQPPVNASAGPGDYQPDSDGPGQVQDVINTTPTVSAPAQTPVANPVGAGSTETPAITAPATTVPVTTPTPVASPTLAGNMQTSSLMQVTSAILGALLLLCVAA